MGDGHVFLRRLDIPLPQALKAKGSWIEDTQGRKYLDASGGAVVVNLGHGREEIATAVYNQILKCHYAHPTMFTTPVVEELAKALVKHAPVGIDRFYFLSSGGEAVETAIKMARQIHIETGQGKKVYLISRWKSYHGLTFGALAASGRAFFRTPFVPMLPEVVHIHPPYCLRCFYGKTYPGCDLRCAIELEQTIQNLGPETVCAFLAETVSGASLASYPPPSDYWPLIREICDRYNVLLILDEVMCGMGRTGKWFAVEHYGITPDIIILGKGMSGGTIALSAVGVQSKYFEIFRQSKTGFVHGGTYSHHPVAAAAGLATIAIMERDNLVDRAAKTGAFLGTQLTGRLEAHPQVIDVRGIGMLWGVELAKDKETLEPFPRRDKVIEQVWNYLFKEGIITYRSTGLAGTHGDALVVAPPFTIDRNDIEHLVDTIAKAVKIIFG